MTHDLLSSVVGSSRSRERASVDMQSQAGRRGARQQPSLSPRRRAAAWILFGLAFFVAGQHLLAHSGWRPLPLSMDWQDNLLGYPTAAVIAITGAMMLERQPPN